MKVSDPKDLMDLLNRLDQTSKDESNEPRRHFRRFSVRGDSQIEPLKPRSTEEPKTIMLRNISRAGVGFLCGESLEIGSMWRMKFHCQNHVIGGSPIATRCCRLVQQDLYIVGASFIIEPHLLLALGVTEAELNQPDPDFSTKLDTSDFVGPDMLTD